MSGIGLGDGLFGEVSEKNTSRKSSVCHRKKEVGLAHRFPPSGGVAT
jgi:hypothetical protein